ncbi:hypothetical protein ATO13_22066 [Stappia sp. 22II-S9-Z10]|nr:hypothetical protein ATO13_22066 [Stappia sp. 22II-S9-Z10]
MREMLEAAWLAGFAASSEGFNGEYPFEDEPERMKVETAEARARAIDSLMAANEPPSFEEGLATLCRREMLTARGDQKRQAAAFERMAHTLGCMAAEIAEGDPAAIDTLMVGAEAHAHQAAVDMAPLIALMGLGRRTG